MPFTLHRFSKFLFNLPIWHMIGAQTFLELWVCWWLEINLFFTYYWKWEQTSKWFSFHMIIKEKKRKKERLHSSQQIEEAKISCQSPALIPTNTFSMIIKYITAFNWNATFAATHSIYLMNNKRTVYSRIKTNVFVLE